MLLKLSESADADWSAYEYADWLLYGLRYVRTVARGSSRSRESVNGESRVVHLRLKKTLQK
jgi:hypothetical protein